MLKRYLSFFICLFLFSAAGAQRIKARESFKAGLAYKTAAQYPEAMASFKKAISLDKKYDSAYGEIGNIYAAGGVFDTAVMNYKQALTVNPGFTAALVGMGKFYRDVMIGSDSAVKSMRLDSAIYFFKAAEETDKKNKEIYYALAWIYNAKQQYEKAIPYAIKSLEVDNTYKPAYGELGHAYRATKNYSGCIEQMKKNLAVSVVDVALLYSGFCYIELKNKEGAMQQYEALLKVNQKMAEGLKKRIDLMQN